MSFGLLLVPCGNNTLGLCFAFCVSHFVFPTCVSFCVSFCFLLLSHVVSHLCFLFFSQSWLCLQPVFLAPKHPKTTAFGGHPQELLESKCCGSAADLPEPRLARQEATRKLGPGWVQGSKFHLQAPPRLHRNPPAKGVGLDTMKSQQNESGPMKPKTGWT